MRRVRVLPNFKAGCGAALFSLLLVAAGELAALHGAEPEGGDRESLAGRQEMAEKSDCFGRFLWKEEGTERRVELVGEMSTREHAEALREEAAKLLGDGWKMEIDTITVNRKIAHFDDSTFTFLWTAKSSLVDVKSLAQLKKSEFGDYAASVAEAYREGKEALAEVWDYRSTPTATRRTEIKVVRMLLPKEEPKK